MKNRTVEKKRSCTPELQKKALLFTAVLVIILDVVAIILNVLHVLNGQDKISSFVEVLSSPAGVRKEEPLPTFDPTNFTFSSHSVQKRLWPSHLMKNLDVPYFDTNDANPLLFPPRKPDALVEHIRGIEVMATNMVITTSGYYYVYSNIIFKPDSARPCKDYDRQSWDHDVVLTRDGDRFASGIILQSSHTCCDNCRREIATSFTGGVLYLEENDKLHCEVSGYGLVSYRKEGSYFGLYRLGNAEQRV